MRFDYRANNNDRTQRTVKEKLQDDNIMQAILTSSPGEIDSLVDEHVTDLQTSNEVLKRLCVAVRYLIINK
jgi:hypothetical protein